MFFKTWSHLNARAKELEYSNQSEKAGSSQKYYLLMHVFNKLRNRR